MARSFPAAIASHLFAAAPERRLALLRAVWPVAVGRELARRSEVVAFAHGVVRIRVPDAAWRRVLLRMRSEILARLARLAGAAAPRRMAFVEGGVAPEPERAAPPAPPSPPPALVVAAAEAIPDRDLRAIFLETASRYLARFAVTSSPDEPR
jgi:Dna[CI] antecedent, DciA